MSAPGETAAGSERPCGLSSLIPLGMSCRGRAEAFARRLQSRLRTLGSQGPVTQNTENEHSENTWLTQTDQQVTSLQPLRHLSHEADSFFDFDIEPESPGSPADECEYSRLIETTSTTPQDVAPESGYVCASPISPEGSVESQSSSDGPYFDPESSDAEQRSITGDYYDCVDSKKESGINSSTSSQSSQSLQLAAMPNGHVVNHHHHHRHHHNHNNIHSDHNSTTILDSDSCSESLPPSQTTATPTTDSLSTCTGMSSASNSTLQDETETDFPICNTVPTLSAASQAVLNRKESMEKSTEILCQILQDMEIKEKTNCEENGHENDDTVLVNGYITNGICTEGDAEPEIDKNAEAETETEAETEINKLEINKPLTMECPQIIEATPPEASPEPDSIKAETNEDTEELLSTTDVEYRRHLSADNDVDVDEDEDRPQRVRRCSSLKSGKTPPGTPGRKKIVRFADVLGLDLADVRTFMDEVPKIPKSAFDDLEVNTFEQPMISLGPRVDKVLVPLFQQPGSLPGFLDMVRERQVCLENAAVTDPITLTITGCVRVRNLDFHKSVYVRYSTDGWRSFADLQANYVENSCDGFSDKFSFILFGNALTVGQRIEIAVRFHCRGQQFWDNNYGSNYCFQCLPGSQPIRPVRPVLGPLTTHVHSHEDSWGGSFY